LHLLKVLKVLFLFSRPDHGVAVPILKHSKDQTSDPVLFLYHIRGAFLLF
jgi:hypothetical protein